MWGEIRKAWTVISFLLLFISMEGNETYRFTYEEVHGLILVKAFINEETEVDFVLDTGSEALIIQSKKMKSSDQDAAFVTINGEIQTQSATLSSIRISNLVIRHRKVYLGDLSALSRFVGREIFGILGLNAFKNQSILIDIEKKQIIIGADRASLNNNGTVVFPLSKLHGIPVVQLPLNNRKLHFLIDSGSSAHVFDKLFATDHLKGEFTDYSVDLVCLSTDTRSESTTIVNSFFLNDLSHERTKMLVRDLSKLDQHFKLPISGLLSPQLMDLRFLYLNFEQKEVLFGLKFPRLKDTALN